MPLLPITRRSFCSNTTLALLAPRLLRAQTTGSRTHPDVAAIDHDRILNAADRYLTLSPAPLTAFPAAHSPGSPNDFFSESSTSAVPHPFTAHSEALLQFSIQLPTLVAAFVITKDLRYANHAANHIRAWFITPATHMTPALPYAQLIPGSKAPHFEAVLETVHLAEVAQAISFLTRTDSLSEEDLSTLYTWFATYLDWLGSDRAALLARDQKDHHGASWLLQAAAYARLLPQPNGSTRKPPPLATPLQLEAPPNQYTGLSQLRHQFRATTLRAQLIADGSFPHELTSPLPYRNSLFTLDLLAGICDLLSTRFDSEWDYELQDGPGMRVAIAHMVPFIANRKTWPYRADTALFNALPLRHPSLVLAGRAYDRPEYVDLWKTLPPDPADSILQRTFPIRQPLLWLRRTPAL